MTEEGRKSMIKIEFTQVEKDRLKKVRAESDRVKVLSQEAHQELRHAILHPWCNRCVNIVGFQCNCTLNYDETIAPTGFVLKEAENDS